MASVSDLAREYADYIRLNKDNPSAIGEIADRINSLVYTSSQNRLSDEDKKSLIDQIEKHLSHKRETKEGYLIVEAEDSTELVRLIQMLRQQTTGK